MENEAFRRVIQQSISRYSKGMIAQDDIEYLDMIIAARELKERNDPDAAKTVAELLEFMRQTDEQKPLHYSLWLAVYSLAAGSLSSFLHSFDIRALKADYDPRSALSGTFRDRFETKMSLPLSAHSELIKDQVQACLEEKDHVSDALERWMAYENEMIRIRNSFDISDVLSVYFAYNADVTDMKELEDVNVSSECILHVQKENSLNEIGIRITQIYDDMITALSLAKPLHLYRICKDTGHLDCYRLSDQEYMGFHVGMFIVENAEINDEGIKASLMTGAGERYIVSGKILKRYSAQIIKAEILFAQGTKKIIDLYLTQRPFALMELSQGYRDFLSPASVQ